MAQRTSLSLSRFTCLTFGLALSACSGEGDTTTVVAACGPGTEIVGQTCVIADAVGSGGDAGGETGGATGNTGGADGGTGGAAETGGASTGGEPSTGGNAETGGASTGGVASTGAASTGGAPTGGANTGGASTGGASTGGAPNDSGWLVYVKSSVAYAVDVTRFPLQATQTLGSAYGFDGARGRQMVATSFAATAVARCTT